MASQRFDTEVTVFIALAKVPSAHPRGLRDPPREVEPLRGIHVSGVQRITNNILNKMIAVAPANCRELAAALKRDQEIVRLPAALAASCWHPSLPMNALRLLRSFLAVTLTVAAALAADATGTWKWQIPGPNGDLETTLKLATKDGKLGGTYQNQFGETAIKDVTFKDDTLVFAVDREFGDNKFTVKFRGKVDGDAIKGEIEMPDFGGDGGTRKMEWNAKRAKDGAAPAKK
jgi:hypothetical protein